MMPTFPSLPACNACQSALGCGPIESTLINHSAAALWIDGIALSPSMGIKDAVSLCCERLGRPCDDAVQEMVPRPPELL